MPNFNVLSVNGNTKRADATYPVAERTVYIAYADPTNANRTYIEVEGPQKRQHDILLVDAAIATVLTTLNATIEGFVSVTVEAINGHSLPTTRTTLLNYEKIGMAYEVDSKARVEYYGLNLPYKRIDLTNALSTLTSAVADITPGAETIAYPLESKTVFAMNGRRIPVARTILVNMNYVQRTVENVGINIVNRQAAAVAKLKVESVAIAGGGTGYTDNDVLTLVGGNGTAATVTVQATAGVIDSVALTTAGSYFSLPDNIAAVTVTGGTGTGATFNIDFEVDSLVLEDAGYGYGVAPVVTISGGGGTGATATVAVSGGKLGAFTVTAPGNNFTSIPTVSIAAPENRTGLLFRADKGKENMIVI